jgi:hypothetical protein
LFWLCLLRHCDACCRICEAYYLPKWCSIADYAEIAKDAGLVDIRTADWTKYVEPFWGKVIQTALTGTQAAPLSPLTN